MVSMGREKEHLVGAYFERASLPDIDELTHRLWKAGLIEKSNRSELIRFCVDFMTGYIEGLAGTIEGVKTAKDFLVLEKILHQDSLEAYAAISTRMVTDNIIASVGGKLTHE